MMNFCQTVPVRLRVLTWNLISVRTTLAPGRIPLQNALYEDPERYEDLERVN